MKWFGPYSWGAPICDEGERVDVPHGDRCVECNMVIYPHDRGFLIPQYIDADHQSEQPFHFRCLMRNTLGPDWERMTGTGIPG